MIKPKLDQTQLTPRQQEIMELICAGCSHKEIQAKLKLGRGCIEYHIALLKSATKCGPSWIHIMRWALINNRVKL